MANTFFKQIDGMGELPHSPGSLLDAQGKAKPLADIGQLLGNRPEVLEKVVQAQQGIQQDVGPSPAELAASLGVDLNKLPEELAQFTSAGKASPTPAQEAPAAVPAGTPQELEQYLITVLGGPAYLKTYIAAGGKVQVTFRTLTADEAVACRTDDATRTTSRRLGMSLCELRINGVTRVSGPAQAGDPERYYHDLLGMKFSETMWRLLHALYRQFQQHVAQLEQTVIQPDFSIAAAGQP